MRSRILAALLVLPGTSWAAPAPEPSLQDSLTAYEERPAAPGLSLPDIDGVVHRLSDYRGKVVIVNFWATWCPPCRREMPSMQRAWKRLRDEGVVFLAVNVGEDVDTIFTFTADYPADYPLLLDRDSRLIESWPVKGLPTSFVIDPGGRLAYRAIGGREWDSPVLLERIRGLLHERD
jgi:peroxiredoxin